MTSGEPGQAAAGGRLHVVATPIGNLEDITLRALRVLRECDAVLAEDTRRTRGLLSHHGIHTPVEAVHEHTAPARIAALADRLAAGARLAMVTDAGTPLVSDPGAALVRACVERGVPVESVPGPSAPVAALACSGFFVPSFEFLGFLPRAGAARARAVERIAAQPGAVVLFEAPGRLADTLADLAAAMPARDAAICRELTKMHEEIVRGPLPELAARMRAREVLGEVTLVVAPLPGGDAPDEPAADAGAIDQEIDALLARGESARDTARTIGEAHGLSKRDAYARVLAKVRAG